MAACGFAKWFFSQLTVGLRDRAMLRYDRESVGVAEHVGEWSRMMSGPTPLFRPEFRGEFVERCRHTVRLRNVSRGEFQRARLVLLLHGDARLSNVAAGAAVELHPNSVRLWRRRWAQGDFSLIDQEGRGRKATFSPAGSGGRQGDCL